MSKFYTVRYKNQKYKEKRIFAGSVFEAWKKFLEMYRHEAPSQERRDYRIE